MKNRFILILAALIAAALNIQVHGDVVAPLELQQHVSKDISLRGKPLNLRGFVSTVQLGDEKDSTNFRDEEESEYEIISDEDGEEHSSRSRDSRSSDSSNDSSSGSSSEWEGDENEAGEGSANSADEHDADRNDGSITFEGGAGIGMLIGIIVGVALILALMMVGLYYLFGSCCCCCCVAVIPITAVPVKEKEKEKAQIELTDTVILADEVMIASAPEEGSSHPVAAIIF